MFSPEQWKQPELTTDDVGRSILNQAGIGAPVNTSARTLWSLPVVLSNVLSAGDVAILGDFAGSAQLFVREQVTISWSENTWRQGRRLPGFRRTTQRHSASAVEHNKGDRS